MDEFAKIIMTKINMAFDGIELGDGVSLNMAEFKERGGRRPEYRDAAIHDERKDWKKISNSILENCTILFNFTDAHGFRFYIPAYMRWCVHNVGSDCIIGDYTIYAIDPEKFENLHSLPMKSFMTNNQLEAMTKFLEWCCCGENAEIFDSEIAKKNLEKMLILIE